MSFSFDSCQLEDEVPAGAARGQGGRARGITISTDSGEYGAAEVCIWPKAGTGRGSLLGWRSLGQSPRRVLGVAGSICQDGFHLLQ